MIGIIGRKLGMSRVFTKDGRSVPVTVFEVTPNRVTQVKMPKRDGYAAIQVTTGERRKTRVNKALAGIFAKANMAPGRRLMEFRFDGEHDYSVGDEIRADLFEPGARVDVQGQTIGKGFAGVVKRHGFRGGRASHGASLAHRKGGSIGQCQSPGRVFPGKKMAGQMGAVARTQQNLEVVRVDVEQDLLLIKGSVPGARGSDVVIRPAIKARTS